MVKDRGSFTPATIRRPTPKCKILFLFCNFTQIKNKLIWLGTRSRPRRCRGRSMSRISGERRRRRATALSYHYRPIPACITITLIPVYPHSATHRALFTIAR